MVVLLNLHNLYESLYDLLNQVYNKYGILHVIVILLGSTGIFVIGLRAICYVGTDRIDM